MVRPDNLTTQEMEWIAFDMFREDTAEYSYEAIADYFNCSTYYAKKLVTGAIKRERAGRWSIIY